MDTQCTMNAANSTQPVVRSPLNRRVARVSVLTGLVGGTAVISSGCTLSDVSAIMSILRLLGII